MSKFVVGFTTSVLVEAGNDKDAVEVARKKVCANPQFLRKVFASRDPHFINSIELAMGEHHV